MVSGKHKLLQRIPSRDLWCPHRHYIYMFPKTADASNINVLTVVENYELFYTFITKLILHTSNHSS